MTTTASAASRQCRNLDTTPGGATVAPLALPSGALFQGTMAAATATASGGAQVGYNYQFTPGSGFVLGFEADIQWLGGDNDSNNGFFGSNLFNHAPVPPFLTPGAGIVGVPVTGSNVALFNQGGGGVSGSDWFATARVRVGYGFDRVLVYATGGLAFTDNGNNNGFFGITNGGQLPARSTSVLRRPCSDPRSAMARSSAITAATTRLGARRRCRVRLDQ